MQNIKISGPDSVFTRASTWVRWVCVLSIGLLSACDLPQPPPNLFYKFDVMRVGQGPSHLLTSDLNLDGEPDLISANTKNSTISILLGKGDGSFASALNIPVGAEPTMAAVGDIDRDGYPDLAVNARGAEMFIVLQGNGDGTFRKPIPTRTGKVPLNIILGDYNNDGKLDAAVTLTFDQMELYMGTGDGRFRKGSSYLTGSRSFSGVTVDFNGDGHLDIALAASSSSASSIRLFMGNGDGTFQKPKRVAEQLVPLALVASDMNEDGKPDLVFAAGQGDNLYMLYSNGDGSFQEPISFSGGGGPFALTTGHFNPDKQKDVAVANSRSSNFSLVIRNPNGTFKYPTRDYVLEGSTPLAITSGDYNHSGMSDIAVASNAKSTIEIYLQRRIFKK
ncbi:MAG: VCBS repeat-containing protein [Nitrospina sp.]|nr:VCBS repeat-containing protein [Nitrospina sp.]